MSDLKRLEQRVDTLDHKVDVLDHKVDALDHKVGELDHKVDALDHKVDALDHKVGELDHKVGELDHKVDRLAVELVRTQADLREVKGHMATKEDISRVLQAIDNFAGKSEAYDRKAFSHADILLNHETRLKDHDQRLSVLEFKP